MTLQTQENQPQGGGSACWPVRINLEVVGGGELVVKVGQSELDPNSVTYQLFDLRGKLFHP